MYALCAGLTNGWSSLAIDQTTIDGWLPFSRMFSRSIASASGVTALSFVSLTW